jgi:hypothetical protein
LNTSWMVKAIARIGERMITTMFSSETPPSLGIN